MNMRWISISTAILQTSLFYLTLFAYPNNFICHSRVRKCLTNRESTVQWPLTFGKPNTTMSDLFRDINLKTRTKDSSFVLMDNKDQGQGQHP